MIRRLPCLALLLTAVTPVTAQLQPRRSIALTIHPKAAPSPALKYEFRPKLQEQAPGNAALGYHRAMVMMLEWHGASERNAKAQRWLAMPLKELPLGEVRTLVTRSRFLLHEVDLAARRARCDWQLEFRSEGIELQQPELQGMRALARFVALQARLEISDGHFDQAVHTLQTGFTMARHLGQGATLIHALVGAAIAEVMSERVEELIQAPGAPNLYWALTVLPRPFIDLREPLQGETLFWLDRMYPQLRDIETTVMTPRQVEDLVDNALQKLTGAESRDPGWTKRLALTAMVAGSYPQAKRFLIGRGRPVERVEAMPTLQVTLAYSLDQYKRLRDDMLKWYYVPYWQAREGLDQWEMQVRTVERREGGLPIASMILPAFERVYSVMTRTDRRIAAGRCIEAIRLDAAAHGGTLPASLDAITEVPIPIDPMRGKPFEYRAAGSRATLSAPPPPREPGASYDTLHYELILKP